MISAKAALRLFYAILVSAVLIDALLPSTHAVEIFKWDKANHLLAFITLSLLARIIWPRSNVVVTLLLLAGFGASIEILQALLGFGRDADWRDFVADVIAIMIGSAAASPVMALLRRLRLVEEN